jgi:N-acetylmuramoyl-L-alanine amidase
VVDLHGGAFRLPDQDRAVGDAGVVRVRAGQFQTKPYVTRVVFDLDRAVDARVLTAPDSFGLVLEVRPLGAPAVQIRPPAPPGAAPPAPLPPAEGTLGPPVAPAPPAAASVLEPPSTHEAPVPPAAPLPEDGIPRVLQVRVEQLSARFRVVVEGTTPLAYTVRELPEPDRIVVDVADAVFVPVKQEIPVAGGVVEEVRAAQFQTEPNVTRVVVVLRRKAAYTVSAGGDAGQFLVVEIPEPSLRAPVVAIDAGHGGRDPGAIGPTGLQEKDVVLDIAQRVRELLVRAGVRVVMTRETDTYVDLPDRPRTAKQQGASVLVSIHANASTRSAVAGSETYYLSPQSLVLAQLIQEELGRVPGLANRGVRTANFLVLREADMPAVLVEVAYLSNADEEARLRQAAFRQRLAEAIGRAVQRFLAVFPVPAH